MIHLLLKTSRKNGKSASEISRTSFFLRWTSLVEIQSPDKRSLCGTLQFKKIIKNFVNSRTLFICYL